MYRELLEWEPSSMLRNKWLPTAVAGGYGRIRGEFTHRQTDSQEEADAQIASRCAHAEQARTTEVNVELRNGTRRPFRKPEPNMPPLFKPTQLFRGPPDPREVTGLSLAPTLAQATIHDHCAEVLVRQSASIIVTDTSPSCWLVRTVLTLTCCRIVLLLNDRKLFSSTTHCW